MKSLHESNAVSRSRAQQKLLGVVVGSAVGILAVSLFLVLQKGVLTLLLLLFFGLPLLIPVIGGACWDALCTRDLPCYLWR